MNATDKSPLSLKRRQHAQDSEPHPKPYRETADVARAVSRLIRAIGKRVATEDSEDLRVLQELDAALDEAYRIAVAGLRDHNSDADIGGALHVTKQAVQQKWPR